MKERGEDVAPDLADLDAAGGIARLLIHRFGVELAREMPTDVDGFMETLRQRMARPASVPYYGGGGWHMYGDAASGMYGGFGGYGSGAYATPDGTNLAAGRSGTFSGGPPQDLVQNAQVRRCACAGASAPPPSNHHHHHHLELPST
eukprot:267335-Chlamydomonas_euryale.AAC.3